MTHSWALQTNHPSCSKFTGCEYLCGLALCQLLSAAMTLICHSRLSSSVSILSALLPLILEPCVSICPSIPVTSTVFQSCSPHLECRNLSAVYVVPQYRINILGWVFSKKRVLFRLSVHTVGHTYVYKQIDGHFSRSTPLNLLRFARDTCMGVWAY